MSARLAIAVVGIGIAAGLLYQPGGARVDVPAPAASASRDAAPASAIATPAADAPASGTVLQRSANGHFHADALINGTPVKFVIDTGATTLALSEADARKAGFIVSPEEFAVVGRGASGEVRGKRISIQLVEIGAKEARDVDAVVLEGGDHSLLGQNVLGQFGSITIAGNEMTLR